MPCEKVSHAVLFTTTATAVVVDVDVVVLVVVVVAGPVVVVGFSVVVFGEMVEKVPDCCSHCCWNIHVTLRKLP